MGGDVLSVEHVRFVLDNTLNVSGSELLVLVALAEWADNDGFCWPSHDSIARRARVSRRQAIRLVQSLVDKGLVKQVGRRQRSNEYVVTCDIAVAQQSEMSHVTSSASHVTSGVSDVTQLCPPSCDTAMSPEPLVEPPIRTTTKNHQLATRSETHQLVDAWAERRGFPPSNWGKASKLAKQLGDAGVTVLELMEIYDWLEADPYWSDKGFDLGTAVSQLDKFRQSKRTPRVVDRSKLTVTERNMQNSKGALRLLQQMRSDPVDDGVIEVKGAVLR
jgi:predicted transcriptional regulator